MSLYNIREKFSYVLATSSIEYIRNYNFNTGSVTNIPLSLANSDTDIPITVNITTTEPWVQVVDPTSGADLKYPNGNVILEPSTNKIVFVKIDLPPQVENIPESVLYPNISLDIKSGSFPIYSPTSSAGITNSKIIPEFDIYYLNVGQVVPVNITVYDTSGQIDLTADVRWVSADRNIVQILEPTNTELDYNPYTPRDVLAVSIGETYVTVFAGDERTVDIKFIVRGLQIDENQNNGNTTPTVFIPTPDGTIIPTTQILTTRPTTVGQTTNTGGGGNSDTTISNTLNEPVGGIIVGGNTNNTLGGGTLDTVAIQ